MTDLRRVSNQRQNEHKSLTMHSSLSEIPEPTRLNYMDFAATVGKGEYQLRKAILKEYTLLTTREAHNPPTPHETIDSMAEQLQKFFNHLSTCNVLQLCHQRTTTVPHCHD